MVFKTTFTDAKKRSRSGATLVDVLVGSALASLVLAALALLTMFGSRSFAAMANYVSLDQYSRNALDRMSKEIRQANRLLGASTNYLMFEDHDGGTLLFLYTPGNGTLYRYKNTTGDLHPLLIKCEYLKFSIFQRNPRLGSYDQYPTAVPDTCKVVQLSWVCSRRLIGNKNTESVQSAKVVIRNK